MDQAIRRLHKGKVLDVVAEIRDLAKQVEDDKSQTKVDNVATYFKERADAVHYDKFREEGWPLSSGKVEGGHIHFVHPISKRGSGWLVENLNNILALMCIRESGWWEEFWGSTQNREAAGLKTTDHGIASSRQRGSSLENGSGARTRRAPCRTARSTGSLERCAVSGTS